MTNLRPRPALDPELAIVESLLPPAIPLNPESFHLDIRAGREKNRLVLEEPDLTGMSQRDVQVTTADGPLGLRIIAPEAARADRPCLFWIHGGGYFLGSAFETDPRLVHWSRELDCVIVSVDYRLAPEAPYPAPLHDCYAGLEWTVANVTELGINLGRLAIGGISAGGGLCAALAIHARDLGEITPCFQLLIYPMIDDSCSTASSQYTDSPIWAQKLNRLGWGAYLGPDHLERDVPITGAPARANAAQLVGLPPAYLCVGTVDIFVDEDIAYAQTLLQAGVPTELHVYPGAYHGFDALQPTTKLGRLFNHDVLDALKRALL